MRDSILKCFKAAVYGVAVGALLVALVFAGLAVVGEVQTRAHRYELETLRAEHELGLIEAAVDHARAMQLKQKDIDGQVFLMTMQSRIQIDHLRALRGLDRPGPRIRTIPKTPEGQRRS